MTKEQKRIKELEQKVAELEDRLAGVEMKQAVPVQLIPYPVPYYPWSPVYPYPRWLGIKTTSGGDAPMCDDRWTTVGESDHPFTLTAGC